VIRINTKNLIGERQSIKIPDDVYAIQIYGCNGSGKSLFLKALYGILSNQWDSVLSIPFEQMTIRFNDQEFSFANEKTHLEATDGNGNRLSMPIDFPMNVAFYEPDMVYYHNFNFPRNCDKDIRCDIFTEVVNEFFVNKKVDYLRPLRFKFVNGDILKYSQLSHGEQRMVLLWYKIIFNDRPTLILLDDPERSLHISTQRKMLPKFYELRKKYGWGHHILYASHSIAFPSSLMELQDDRFIRFELHEKGYWEQMDIAKHYYKERNFCGLVFIVEESHFTEVREKTVSYIGKLKLKDSYGLLENLVISDSSDSVRWKAIKAILSNFPKRGKVAVDWVLSNERDCWLKRKVVELVKAQ